MMVLEVDYYISHDFNNNQTSINSRSLSHIRAPYKREQTKINSWSLSDEANGRRQAMIPGQGLVGLNRTTTGGGLVARKDRLLWEQQPKSTNPQWRPVNHPINLLILRNLNRFIIPTIYKATSSNTLASRSTPVLLLDTRNNLDSRSRDTHSTRPATQPSSRCLARSRRVRQLLCHVCPPSQPEPSNNTDLLQLPIISGVCMQSINLYELRIISNNTGNRKGGCWSEPTPRAHAQCEADL